MARTSSSGKRVGLTSSTMELDDKAAARFTDSSIPFNQLKPRGWSYFVDDMTWMRMASMLLAALALVAAAATPGEAGGNHGASKFRVTGTVLCQDCTKNWNAYAYNAKPINGSLVAVTCLDKHTGRTVFHGNDATDKEGLFDVEVPYVVNSCHLDPSECLVRLVYSGDKGCAVLTNFNSGRTGERPFRPYRSCPTEVVYSAGPYYATLPQCDVDDDEKSCS